ncbi:MAG: DNA mismatch repair endonuclease MutL [Firmicutes bacterium]|nr:DNA mismatch repair endonuclease MutL [Bacillota bacterium]
MKRIRVLGDGLANKIAAGEVVERPASVVKELVENSLDAGATIIQITIAQGGKELIQVEDNGAGIPSDDVPLAFERHATSKLQSSDDLFAISTLGFRGEALPSIAAVSQMTLITKTTDEPAGSLVEVHGGQLIKHQPIGASNGTSITVRQLFYNTPVRYKFLKQDATERRYILDTVTQIAMAHPEVRFTLIADGTELFKTAGDGDTLSVILAAYGRKVAEAMIPVDRTKDLVRVVGYVSKPHLHRGTRKDETFLVNGRVIASRMLSSALERGYQSLLPARRFPIGVLGLELDPSLVDVNVHPAKAEVRFQEEREIFQRVMFAVKEALLSQDLSSSYALESKAPPQSQRMDYREYRQKLASPSPSQSYSDHKPLLWGRDEVAASGPVVSRPITQPREQSSLSTFIRERDQDLWARKKVVDVVANSNPAEGRLHSHPMWSGLVPMGQWINTYIVLGHRDALWLIDQHIAHERVLYEKLRSSYRRNIGSQPLLLPLHLELPPSQAAVLADHLEMLTELSFGIEEFGGGGFLVRSVPLILGQRLEQASIEEMIVELIEHWEKGGDKLDATITTMACRAAIKAGDSVSWSEIEDILLDLAETENPYTCPHGRPIIVKLGLPEVERRFGRR